MGVELVQIAERPQGAPRLEPHAVGKAHAGQGADVRLFDLELRRLAGVGSEAEGDSPLELVVDVAREGNLAVAEGEPFGGAFRFMTGLEAGNRRNLLRE